MPKPSLTCTRCHRRSLSFISSLQHIDIPSIAGVSGLRSRGGSKYSEPEYLIREADRELCDQAETIFPLNKPFRTGAFSTSLGGWEDWELVSVCKMCPRTRTCNVWRQAPEIPSSSRTLKTQRLTRESIPPIPGGWEDHSSISPAFTASLFVSSRTRMGLPSWSTKSLTLLISLTSSHHTTSDCLRL